MASRRTVERFATANRDIRILVRRDLRSFFAALPEDPMRAARALDELVPALVVAYGDTAATVAADFFDEMRLEANAPLRHAARLAAAPATEQVLTNVKWASSPMFLGDRAGSLARLDHIVDRMSLQAGRDTIDLSVRSDPARPRWARVPTGPETCAFCLMLASNGPVYGSERTAGGNANKYHGDCDCTPTPIWPDDALPDGYDPDALYRTYQEARAAAGSGDPKAILSELRKQQGSN